MMNTVVIDDYPMEGRTIEFVLKKHRPEVKYIGQAYSGIDGLNLILKTRPSIAFVDIKMPIMDGIELTKELRKYELNTKIVFVTAFDEFSLIQKALRLGAYDYILKPIKSKEIIEVIDKIKVENESAKKTNKNMNQLFSDILEPLIKQLTLEITKGNCCKSLEAYSLFWGQLCLDTKNNFSHIKCILENLSKEIINTIKNTEHCTTKNCDEVLNYTYNKISNELSSAEDMSVMELSFKKFVEYSTNIFNSSLFECGYEQVKLAKEIVIKNIDKNITLESVSKSIFISPYYLSRLFKKHTGKNYIDYVIEQRIEQSKFLLLTTNKTIDSISLDVGYEEANSFRRIFKKQVGMSPSEYRRINNSAS